MRNRFRQSPGIAATTHAHIVVVVLRRQRDEQSFAALVEKYSAAVGKSGLAVIRNVHAAADAFQETFVRLAEKARKLKGHGGLTG